MTIAAALRASFLPRTSKVAPTGVRGVEIGSIMFGMQPDGTEKPAAMDLVRLAFPRRVYTQSHADYLAEVLIAIYNQREKVPGHRIEWQAPFLRHFTIRMKPV